MATAVRFGPNLGFLVETGLHNKKPCERLMSPVMQCPFFIFCCCFCFATVVSFEKCKRGVECLCKLNAASMSGVVLWGSGELICYTLWLNG